MNNNMKTNYIAAIEKKFTELTVPYNTKGDDSKKMFVIPTRTDNAPGLTTMMLVDEEGDVKIRCYLANDVAPDKHAALVQTLNRLNSEFRFVCMSLDKDGDVCAAIDFVLMGDEETVGQQVMTLLSIFVNIVDKCIPDVMRTIWDENEPSKVEAPVEVVRVDLFNKNGGDN